MSAEVEGLKVELFDYIEIIIFLGRLKSSSICKNTNELIHLVHGLSASMPRVLNVYKQILLMNSRKVPLDHSLR